MFGLSTIFIIINATENEGNTENEDDVGDSGDMVAEVALGGQKEQLRQNSDGSNMREG